MKRLGGMSWKENLSRSKEVLGAYLRQGAHELGFVFYGPGTAAQHPEYGMIATKPPSMVVDGLRGSEERQPAKDDPAPALLQRYMEHGKDRDPTPEPERDQPELERD